MAPVDALSRVVCFIDSIPLEKELQYRQLQDPGLKRLADSLKHEDHNKFELIDGLIFRKGIHKQKFVVPDSMVTNIIHVYHDDMAHCEFEKTIRGVSNNYWFPSLKKIIRSHIDNCLIANSANFHEDKLQVTDTPSLPFEIFHMDHFGPIKESIDGYKHILVTVDAFSRFTVLSKSKLRSREK